MIKGKYVFSRNVAFAGTFFINKIDRFQGIQHDFKRIQLDLEFNFE